jgi:glyoxylase-like metal-dependent hydrolase (beta-lactamase superfamily II)
MSQGPIRVGEVDVSVVCQGFAPLSLSDECPDRDVDWAAERARFGWAFHGDDAWAWHVHAFAVHTPTALIMVDTGLGTYAPYRPWAEHTTSGGAYASAGVDPAAVRHVIVTHLHADHAGGTVTADGQPRFPNAVYHVHPADWRFFAASDDPDDYSARRSFLRIQELGMLDLDPDDRTITPGVEVMHTPGHTPGHRSAVLRSGDDALLLTGDLLHLPVQAQHPDWPSSHDEDPELGAVSRSNLLARAHSEAWDVAVPHFARPFGRIGAEGWEGV